MTTWLVRTTTNSIILIITIANINTNALVQANFSQTVPDPERETFFFLSKKLEARFILDVNK